MESGLKKKIKLLLYILRFYASCHLLWLRHSYLPRYRELLPVPDRNSPHCILIIAWKQNSGNHIRKIGKEFSKRFGNLECLLLQRNWKWGQRTNQLTRWPILVFVCYMKIEFYIIELRNFNLISNHMLCLVRWSSNWYETEFECMHKHICVQCVYFVRVYAKFVCTIAICSEYF